MTSKTSFSAEEWNLLRVAPVLVASGVSAADPGGLVGAFQEASAGMQGMMESLKQGSAQELANALLSDKSMPEMPSPRTLMGEGNREQQLTSFKGQAINRALDALALLKS